MFHNQLLLHPNRSSLWFAALLNLVYCLRKPQPYKMKPKQIIILLLLSIATGIGSYFIAHQWALYILSENPSDIYLSDHFNTYVFSAFKTLFAILLASIVLPVFIYQLSLKQLHILLGWRGFLILEVAGVLFSFLLTPPDLVSSLLFWVVWQLPVLVNMLSIQKKKRAVNRDL